MRFEQHGDEPEVAAAAARILAETVAQRRDARMVLPAGRTPLPLFVEFVRRAREGDLDLSQVRFIQLDEYVGVSPRDSRSFHALLRRHLLDPLRRDRDQDLLLDGAALDPQVEIERHATRLAQQGGADLVVLGLGGNGHVAFNEPGSTLEQRARVVDLARETRLAAQAEFGVGDGPTRGITLGLHEIAAARRIVLLVTGAAKAAILAALFDEPADPQRPASLLLDHPDFRILADVAAAERLRAPGAPAPSRS